MVHAKRNRQRFRPRGARRDRAVFEVDFFTFDFLADAFLRTRSGSRFAPVSRFHSSKVSFEILPSTSNCANLRRWAWLLKGIRFSG
jgi:hypothetical protein